MNRASLSLVLEMLEIVHLEPEQGLAIYLPVAMTLSMHYATSALLTGRLCLEACPSFSSRPRTVL